MPLHIVTSYSVVVLSDYHTDWNTDKSWFKIHSKYIFLFSRLYRKAMGLTQSPSWSARPAASPELKAADALSSLLAWKIKNAWSYIYRSADKSLARPGRKQANVSVRMAWISFGALPCGGGDLMTARVSMSLKSSVSLTCFRACFLPGRTNDFSAPRYVPSSLYNAIQGQSPYTAS